MAGQFTLFEISVAAAIGVTLLSAERGLVPALVLVLTMVGLQRLGIRNRRLKTRLSGEVSLLFADGHLHLDALRSSAISRVPPRRVVRQGVSRMRQQDWVPARIAPEEGV